MLVALEGFLVFMYSTTCVNKQTSVKQRRLGLVASYFLATAANETDTEVRFFFNADLRKGIFVVLWKNMPTYAK